MIAFDTNVVVRMLVEDDKRQAGAVQEAVLFAEKNSIQILILSEVLIETVWVLESVYQCKKNEITQFLETLISASTFTHPNPDVIRKAIQQYKRGGDFADFVIDYDQNINILYDRICEEFLVFFQFCEDIPIDYGRLITFDDAQPFWILPVNKLNANASFGALLKFEVNDSYFTVGAYSTNINKRFSTIFNQSSNGSLIISTEGVEWYNAINLNNDSVLYTLNNSGTDTTVSVCINPPCTTATWKRTLQTPNGQAGVSPPHAQERPAPRPLTPPAPPDAKASCPARISNPVQVAGRSRGRCSTRQPHAPPARPPAQANPGEGQPEEMRIRKQPEPKQQEPCRTSSPVPADQDSRQAQRTADPGTAA